MESEWAAYAASWVRIPPSPFDSLSASAAAQVLLIAASEILAGAMPDVVVTQVDWSGPRRSRKLEERVAVRFPDAARALGALALRRFKPGSRLRRVLLRRALVAGWGAVSRQDFELRRVFFAPEVESEFPSGAQTLGLSGVLQGHASMEGAIREFTGDWESWELEPAFVLDIGDRLLMLGFFHARGRASGVEINEEYAQLLTLQDGFVTRDQSWLGWEEALRTAGLDPAKFRLPPGGKEGLE